MFNFNIFTDAVWFRFDLQCNTDASSDTSDLISIQINGVEKQVCRELHIAYRYGDHYDSVRPTGDNSESPALLRIEVGPPTDVRQPSIE